MIGFFKTLKQKITTALFSAISPKFYNRLNYYYLHLKVGILPKSLNLTDPKTFNEKIIWLKLNYRSPHAQVLADKVAVKSYVSKKLAGVSLMPTLGVYSNAQDIDYDKLPNSFVMKVNHGSGWNILCKDKSKIKTFEINDKLNQWLGINYYDIGKEYQYHAIEPKILCETYMENEDGSPLVDYKIFCFSGEPKYIQVDLDRFGSHRRNYYNIEWEMIPFTTLYPLGNKQIEKPKLLSDMLAIARELANGHPFARVDLYEINNAIYFGEFTFHPGGGFEPFIPQRYDLILGDLLNLPKRNN
jgi:hypothetical protein